MLFLVADSLEKLLRVRKLVVEHRGTPAEKYDQILQTFEDFLGSVASLFTDNSARIGALLHGEGKSQHLNTLRGVAYNALQSAFGTHESLVVLPRGSVRRELPSCLAESFGNPWRAASPSVMLSTLYSSYEYGFEDVLSEVEALGDRFVRVDEGAVEIEDQRGVQRRHGAPIVPESPVR